MFLLPASMSAQDNAKIGIDVEGMLIGTKNEYSEVVAKLGKPIHMTRMKRKKE